MPLCLCYHVGWLLIVTTSTAHNWFCIWNRKLCTSVVVFGAIARLENQTWMVKMMFNCFTFFLYEQLLQILVFQYPKMTGKVKIRREFLTSTWCRMAARSALSVLSSSSRGKSWQSYANRCGSVGCGGGRASTGGWWPRRKPLVMVLPRFGHTLIPAPSMPHFGRTLASAPSRSGERGGILNLQQTRSSFFT